jgi:drug/metabolite transporter (DMT)-like permease
MKEQKTTNHLLMGIICIIISAFCFSLMSLFIRLSGDVPVIQKCFFRNAVAFVIALIAMIRAKTPVRIGKGNLKYLLIRSIAGTLGMLLNFYAVDHLPISDASILNKLSPFFAIIFSVFVLKEVANKYEWFAVVVAFVGALFVVKPSFNLEVIPALAGVLGGCGAGLAYTYVRKLGQRGENGMMIVLFFSGFSTFSLLPYLILHFTPMTLQQWIYLWLTGAAAAGGQVFITKAYAYAPAKEISVYDFSNVVFSAIWGILFLGQMPDRLSIIGYIIIIGTAVIKWWFSMRAKDVREV